MTFDAVVAAAVCAELQKLVGAKIMKIYQPDRNMLVLKYHLHTEAGSGNGKLLISSHPQNHRIHITETAAENPSAPPLFCMVLRKYLEGGRISSVSQRPHERIIDIGIDYVSEIGDRRQCLLTVELMGKHSNIILVDGEGFIIDAVRRFSHNLSRHRQVLPREKYLPPPEQDKLAWADLGEDELGASLFALPEEIFLAEALTKTVCGVSPFFARELLSEAGISPQTPLSEVGQFELSAVLRGLQRMQAMLTEGRLSPVVSVEGGAAKDFYPFAPALWQGQELVAFAFVSEAIDYYYERREGESTFTSRKRELLKVVGAHYARLDKKASLQQADFTHAESAEVYKQAGDLLAANLYSLERGLSSVTLDNFYDEGKPIEIALDPVKTPEENMRNYYRLYNKNKNALKLIAEQLTRSKEELFYLGEVLNAAENTASNAEIEEIKDELREGGYLKEKSSDKKAKKKAAGAEEKLPPLEFTSSDGFTILVGRNNKQNDLLTLKKAAKSDLWLHTKDIPGSHVIIKTEGREVPDTTLAAAAALAAGYSRAKNSSKVPVDYTFVAQVKKPAGAKPGRVIYFQQKTIMVEPKSGI